MKIVLYGDSITDAGRNRGLDFHCSSYGNGYANFIAGELLSKHPTEYEIYNRGISGDRIVDLYARIKRDVWNLHPDVLSILIGVNDVWHELSESPNGVELERWDKMYRMLIDDTLKVLPNIKIIICEPFVLEGAATSEHMDKFLDVHMYAKAAKQIAEDYNFPFVALQDMLHEAALQSEPKYVLDDGVHPATGGAKLIADAWLKVFNENK
jgi:lysophospholipase L1-like esterase